MIFCSIILLDFAIFINFSVRGAIEILHGGLLENLCKINKFGRGSIGDRCRCYGFGSILFLLAEVSILLINAEQL